jgi:hypothetical protein
MPFGLDTRGRPVFHQERATIWWPGCPRRWDYPYRYGGEALPLSEILRWEIERGTHRRRLSAGGSRLLREYTRVRDLPQMMAENAVADKLKDK